MDIDLLQHHNPDSGTVESTELVVSEDVLVKQFSLGADGKIDPHTHNDSTNILHLLKGSVEVVQDETSEVLTAPAVIHNKPGVTHGVKNVGDSTAVVTASLCPLP